ncbi:O-methyltransferase [Marinisporobacter balticus]|uniref:tRNA 5-hydroxyuridine methyltransferase n=1 Tax=Marinisporobacter balticus TaxID=2018667 RepID=A0A4R2KWZ4_9FIRM|nr:O-methyltransferase [Marinisporobacter balticus]TCO79081.1 putative O-methyltransferase YrrM [Marinisporobacter balticus]
MSNIVNELVEAYIRDTLPQNEGHLKEMEDYARMNHVPIVQPEVAKLLEVITKINQTKSILEVGTAIGYSAIVFTRAMEDGKLISIERRADMVEIARENIKMAELDGQIKILEGNAEEVIPTLEGQFDLIFLDAAKGQYMNFLSESIDLLKVGGVLISDNVLYKGMIASNEYVIRRKITIVKRMRNYLEYITKHPQLTTSLLSIGDGVAISYKK